MKNFLKILLIIILFALIIATSYILRNAIIIRTLQGKISNYASSTNYSIKAYNYYGDSLHIAKTFVKDNTTLTKLSILNETDKREVINYTKDGIINTYITSNEVKVATLNSNGLPSPMKISNPFGNECSFLQMFLMSTFSTIESETCNGKDCYKVNLSYSSCVLYDADSTSMVFYIEKDTGLLVRSFNGTSEVNGEKCNLVTDYHYSFNSITDADLKEPDVSEYTIKQQ